MKKIGLVLRVLGVCLLMFIAVHSAIFAHKTSGNYTQAIGLAALAVVFGLLPTPKVRF